MESVCSGRMATERRFIRLTELKSCSPNPIRHFLCFFQTLHALSCGSLLGATPILLLPVEAVFAAIYLDSDIASISRIIHTVLLDKATDHVVEERRDYKTALQELVQREEGSTLTYHLVGESGPDHNKLFVFEVLVNGAPAGQGSGHSKKEAEQSAARDALEKMGQ